MHLTYRNVNAAFAGLVKGIHDGTIPTVRENSRNGPVLRIPEPLIVTYQQPRERVLFNQARDANPFMQLYESLWMLAGRNDVAPLLYYCSKFLQFSDDGKIFNGAYGYRWRRGNGIDDQLSMVICHLRRNPESRRAVLSMWNVEDDLLKIDTSKDVCCNLDIMFSIRDALRPEYPTSNIKYKYLDMTVTNRSNDLILGMLGANVVHFSMLQEYVAACVGVEVGVYNQFTNNGHVYEWNWEPEKWLVADQDTLYVHYKPSSVAVPLVTDPAAFDAECAQFVTDNADGETITGVAKWTEPFLNDVAQPMCHAFHNHKWRDYDAAQAWVDKVKADDWRIAAANWIAKRRANWERKSAADRRTTLQDAD